MFQLITITLSLAACAIVFIFGPIWAWVPIGVLDIFFLIQLISIRKAYNFTAIPTLSQEANSLWLQYGHYFIMPLASKDASASAATTQFAGIILAILCALKGFYWAFAIAILNWFLMGAIAVKFSPAALLAKIPSLRVAHDEIVFHLQKEQRKET